MTENNLQIYSVPVSQIIADPEQNVRFAAVPTAKIVEMVRSFETEGQQSPIRLEGPTSADKYILRYGSTRLAAGQRIALKGSEALGIAPNTDYTMLATIQEPVEDSDMVRQQNIFTAATENLKRNDMTPMDKAKVIKLMEAAHATVAVTMDALGLNPRSADDKALFGRLKALNTAAPEVQAQIHARTLSVDTVINSKILDLYEDAQREVLAELEAKNRLKKPAADTTTTTTTDKPAVKSSSKATKSEVTAAVASVVAKKGAAVVKTPTAPKKTASTPRKAAKPSTRGLLGILSLLKDRATNSKADIGKAIASSLTEWILDSELPEQGVIAAFNGTPYSGKADKPAPVAKKAAAAKKAAPAKGKK
jgi:hypothetical protein